MKAPPRGKLFQEELRREPFWMLVACALVNKTTWEQAEPAFLTLRKRWPTAEKLAKARPSSLEPVLRPLGLWRQRAARLPLLARRFLESPPTSAKDVLMFPTCGHYASDSWAIFIERRTDLNPTDGKLAWYLEKLKHDRRLTMPNTAKKISLTTDNSTVAELLAIYNTEAALRGQPQLASWKQGKEKLAGKIAALCEAHPLIPKVELEAVKVVELESDEEQKKWDKFFAEGGVLMNIATKEQTEAEVKCMPEIIDAGCIKDVACQLLTAVRCVDPSDNRVVGFSYSSILRKIAIMFPKSASSNACLRWYLVRIRQEIEGFDKHKLPIRFKRPKTML